MRELTSDEIEQVGGGIGIGEYAADGGGLGSIIGTLSSGTLYGAGRDEMAGGLLGAFFSAERISASFSQYVFFLRDRIRQTSYTYFRE